MSGASSSTRAARRAAVNADAAAHVVQPTEVVVEAEQEAAQHRLPVGAGPDVRPPAGDDDVGRPLVLDLALRPDAGLVPVAQSLDDEPVDAGRLEPGEPGRRDSGIPRRRRQEQRRGPAGSDVGQQGAAPLVRVLQVGGPGVLEQVEQQQARRRGSGQSGDVGPARLRAWPQPGLQEPEVEPAVALGDDLAVQDGPGGDLAPYLLHELGEGVREVDELAVAGATPPLQDGRCRLLGTPGTGSRPTWARTPTPSAGGIACPSGLASIGSIGGTRIMAAPRRPAGTPSRPPPGPGSS